jgi:type VI secretion system protein ImpL
MARLWQFLTNTRVLAVIGIAALAAVLLLGAESLEVAAIWAVLAGLLLLAAWGSWWLARGWLRKRAGARLSEALVAQAGPEGADGTAKGNDAQVLRQGMLEAINTIKTSKLGLTRGAQALYELP